MKQLNNYSTAQSLKDVLINSDGFDVGGLVGSAGFTNSTTIVVDNCDVVNCTISGTTCVGGQVGGTHFNISEYNCNVVDCTITGEANVGGLVGYTDTEIVTDNCDVINCKITVSGGYGGGVVGFANSVNCICCKVSNSIISAILGSSALGGMVGIADSVSITSCEVLNSTISGVAVNVGGMVGIANPMSINPASITSCKVLDCTITGHDDVGGLVGSGDFRIVDGGSGVNVLKNISINFNEYHNQAGIVIGYLAGDISLIGGIPIYVSLNNITGPETLVGNYADSEVEERIIVVYSQEIIDSGYCGKQGDNLQWSLYEDGTLVISGNGEMKDYALESPWSIHSDSVKYVNIENGVTSIGSRAFRNCNNLMTVSIPSGLTSIGFGAFYDCSNIASLSIPSTVVNIADGAFAGCHNLTKITIDSANTAYKDSDGALFSKSGDAIISYPPGKAGDTYEIPVGVTSIAPYAFAYCTNLNHLVIPSGVTSIGNFAFTGCKKITNIVIPTGVASLGICSFSGCSELTSVVISEGVVSIDEFSFSDCIDLISVSLPNSLTSIGGLAFAHCINLNNVVIPAGVTEIRGAVFYGCSNLSAVSFCGSVSPTIDSSSCFDFVSTSGSFTVPTGTSAAYTAVLTGKGVTLDVNHWVISEASILPPAGVPVVTSSALVEGTHKLNTALTVSWTTPSTNPDSYVLYVYGGGQTDYIYRIDGSTGNTFNIPASVFTSVRDYSVDVYAIKAGYAEDAPGNLKFHVGETIECTHVNQSEKPITVNGISESFPMDNEDGTHYWYVDKVCDDCGAVIVSQIKKSAAHNSDSLSKNGVCECNYHTISLGTPETMFAKEDVSVYLIPESTAAYSGGSINANEEVSVLAAGLGAGGEWSLIQYSVTGTDRTKIRFAETEILYGSSITITNLVDGYEHQATEDLVVRWSLSGSIVACNVTLLKVVHFPEFDDTYEVYNGDSLQVSSDTVFEEMISKDSFINDIPDSFKYNLGDYIIIVHGYDNSGVLVAEDRVSLIVTFVSDTFSIKEDSWFFTNSYDAFADNLERRDNNYYFKWDDFSIVCGDGEIAKKVFEKRYKQNPFNGACAGMVASSIAIKKNILPMTGFYSITNSKYNYGYIREIAPRPSSVSHVMFDSTKTHDLGQFMLQIMIYQMSLPVQSRYFTNGIDMYDKIISLLESKDLVSIAMSGKSSHAILGYAVESEVNNYGDGAILIYVCDPNLCDNVGILVINYEDNTVKSWEYKVCNDDNSMSSTDYSSETHNLFYLSSDDVLELYFNDIHMDVFKFKEQNELLIGGSINTSTNMGTLNVVDSNGEEYPVYKIITTDSDNSENQDDTPEWTFSRIPKEEINLVSELGGSAIIMDEHSSVELTLDANMKAAVSVDDSADNSVCIQSDTVGDEHPFAVTYGYDKTAGKGISGITIQGVTDEIFGGKASDTGVDFSGLSSAVVSVENEEGKSIRVSVIENAEDYDKLSVDISDDVASVIGEENGKTSVISSVSLQDSHVINPTPELTPSHSSSRNYGSSVWLPATAEPTAAPTAEPTQGTPAATQPVQPTPQASTPAPFIGILAGLGAAGLLFTLRRK